MKNIDYRHIVQAEDIIPIKDHVLVQDMDFQAQVADQRAVVNILNKVLAPLNGGSEYIM